MSGTLAAPAAPDPTAGAAPAAPDVPDSPNVVASIVQNSDGTYTVYSGMPPDNAGQDMSAADAGAMGASGDQPMPDGTMASSIGDALKAVMDILKENASSAPGAGTPADQFAAGFGGAEAGPSASMPQKY